MSKNQTSAKQVYLFPASFTQQRLWFLNLMEPDSPFYNIPACIRLYGNLNITALESALNEIVSRHESLRTTFGSVDAVPVQMINPLQPLNIALVDLSNLLQSDREESALRICTQEAKRPFNLEEGPLLRASLLKLDQQDHLLLVVMHHIISDGWSVRILLREMELLYRAFVEGRPSPLPKLSIQYADYANWEREYLKDDVIQQQLDYWKNHLAGELTPLQMPTDRPRPEVQSFRGSQVGFTLSRQLTDSLKSLSRVEGVTLFMTVLAAFKTLLYRYTGQQTLLLGAPVANRDQAETETMIGCFVNTLVLKTDLSGNPAFTELLTRIKDVAREAYSNQDVPFERLVEELKPQRDLSRSVLFQAMLAFEQTPMLTPSLPGLKMERIEIDRGTSLFDLLMLMENTGDELIGTMQYNSDIFDSSTIERLVEHFRILLENIVADPSQSISEIPMLAESERELLVKLWNETHAPYASDNCIHKLFEAQVARTPHSIAVVLQGKELTYEELNHRANQLAHYLIKKGVGPEVIVGISLERSAEMIIAMLGVMKAGGGYVPLDPGYPKQRLAFMLEDAGVPVLLTQESLLDNLPEQTPDVIALDTAWNEIALESEENPVTEVGPDNIVYVIYTSGATGRPKGTIIQHASLVDYTRTVTTEYAMVHDDRVLQFCSMSFDISAEEIYPCLLNGATLVLRNDDMMESIPIFLDTCREWNISFMSLPTAYWHEITASLGTDAATLPDCFRMVIIAGERTLPDRLALWRDKIGERVRLINTYGLTESTIISTACELTGPPQPDLALKEVSIGSSIRNTQLYVLDSNQQPAPIGVPGELFIGGLLLARGYFNRPDLTAARFIPDPFSGRSGARLYRTGDLARYLPDGTLEFFGRIDHQVKIRGFRIEIGEIEAALNQHPAVQDIVVVATSDGGGEKRLVAYVVTKEQQSSIATDLRKFLKERLPHYMIPSIIVPLSVLPMTPNGKVDRQALPDVSGVRPDIEMEYIAPGTELETVIAEIWQEVLKIDRVGTEDNFFELGGHSLLVVQLRARLAQALNRDISIVELFKAPTVGSFARYLTEAPDEQSSQEQLDIESRRISRKRRRELRQAGQGEAIH